MKTISSISGQCRTMWVSAIMAAVFCFSLTTGAVAQNPCSPNGSACTMDFNYSITSGVCVNGNCACVSGATCSVDGNGLTFTGKCNASNQCIANCGQFGPQYPGMALGSSCFTTTTIGSSPPGSAGIYDGCNCDLVPPSGCGSPNTVMYDGSMCTLPVAGGGTVNGACAKGVCLSMSAAGAYATSR